MFIWGVVLSAAYSLAVREVSVSGVLTTGGFAALVVVELVFCCFIFVYVLAVYPSLFEDRPYLRSGTVVSLLNGVCGGIVFGALFTTNYASGKKGISYIVYAVFMAIAFLSLGFQITASF